MPTVLVLICICRRDRFEALKFPAVDNKRPDLAIENSMSNSRSGPAITIGLPLTNVGWTAIVMFRARLLQSTLLLLLLAANDAFTAEPAAAETSATDRPRIGLVLSGGGARGAAHVGRAQSTRRNAYPIDAMRAQHGRCCGRAYASGMSAEEVDRLLISVDWQDSFSDRPPRRDLGLDANRRPQFSCALGIGVKSDGFNYRKGLFKGKSSRRFCAAQPCRWTKSTTLIACPCRFEPWRPILKLVHRW